MATILTLNYTVRDIKTRKKWQYKGMPCFARLQGSIYDKEQYPKHPFDGTRYIYLEIPNNINVNIVNFYIEKVLKHPDLMKLYNVKFKRAIINGNKVLVMRFLLCENYKYSLVYLSLVRFIIENWSVIASWYDLYSNGIDSMHALFLAALGSSKNETMYLDKFDKSIIINGFKIEPAVRGRSCDHNPAYAYRWDSTYQSYIPNKNWVAILAEQIKNKNEIQSTFIDLFTISDNKCVTPIIGKRFKLGKQIKKTYTTGDYDKLAKLLTYKACN